MSKQRMIVYRGPSALDPSVPIVVLATYDTRTGDKSSANAKTGGMIETWILRDDIAPLDALREGTDTAICGDCPHRSRPSGGSGACYVNVGQAPRSTWAAYKRNGIGHGPRQTRPFDVSVFAGRKVRIGSYGDPAAVPFDVWEQISAAAAHCTGYTHQWRHADPRFARICRASVDGPEHISAARELGYRLFVVRPIGTPKPRGLITCPASAEAGRKTTCSVCLQCGGTDSGRRHDVTIEAHGSGARRFAPLAIV